MSPAAAAPPPPRVAPAAVVFGRVAVAVGPRTRRVLVILDGRVRRALKPPRGPRRISVALPTGRWRFAVRAVGPGGARSSAERLVWVLPRSGSRAGTTEGRLDRRLQLDLERVRPAAPLVGA